MKVKVGIVMKITTVGLGYIGLPTSVMFAKHGANVVGVDIKQEAVDLLNHGQIHIEEPGLQEVLDEVIQTGKFKASTEPEEADVYIIAVPTPNNDDEYKSCDLSNVMTALESIQSLLKKGDTVIVESTIGPRSMNDYVAPFIANLGFKIGEDIFVVHCPERVLPGQILHELIYNNRIIGGMTPACAEAGRKVYGLFVQGEMIETSAKTAEMSKLMENTFRDVNIALANELTKICNHLNIDVLEVIEMANKHPRVNLHTPGPGVGGHCLAVDPYFVIAEDPENSQLIQKAREINNSMPEYVTSIVKEIINHLEGNKVTVLGLTYKGNVDDIRESPAIDIYNLLKENDELDVVAYDPHVKKDWVSQDLNDALHGSSLALVLSNHTEFKSLTDDDFSGMKDKYVFDTKNVLSDSFTDLRYFNYGNIQRLLKELK